MYNSSPFSFNTYLSVTDGKTSSWHSCSSWLNCTTRRSDIIFCILADATLSLDSLLDSMAQVHKIMRKEEDRVSYNPQVYVRLSENQKLRFNFFLP